MTIEGQRQLLATVAEPAEPDAEALRFPEGTLTYGELRDRALATLAAIGEAGRVAVWAEPRLETAVAVVAGLLAGSTLVPINPKLGPRELGHIVSDSEPELILASADADLPAELASLPRRAPAMGGGESAANPDTPGGEGGVHGLRPEPDPEAPAFIVYTSGTTGPPKGVLMPRRTLITNLAALADAWAWTAEDVVVQGLPLFHAHGLMLGTLGPLQLGGRLHHIGRFSIEDVTAALAGEGTMLFAVPTMYHRIAEALAEDGGLRDAVAGARLLVSGSAGLAESDYRRIEAATGQRVIERYGLTETLMICAARADGERRPGTVGPPLPGVELRLLDDDGRLIDPGQHETIGEIHARGPNLFLGYLNRPDATAEVMREGWFRTGDVACWLPGGQIRILGRKSTDLIKTGGFKVGAGEIEATLAELPAIAEVAVIGEPDPDLGERIVACVVVRPGHEISDEDLINHVAEQLTPHKRPREIRRYPSLPRNALGKIVKSGLRASRDASVTPAVPPANEAAAP